MIYTYDINKNHTSFEKPLFSSKTEDKKPTQWEPPHGFISEGEDKWLHTMKTRPFIDTFLVFDLNYCMCSTS